MSEASFIISFDGWKFNFPELSERDLVHRKIRSSAGFYEHELLRHLAERVKGRGVAVDCGANIGNHTLFFAGVMGLQTLAVEPVERNLRILRDVVAMNGLGDRVRVVGSALDDHEGEVTMTLDSPGNFGMYRVGEGDGPTVPATTIDRLTGDLDRPVKLIKIDVEGFQDQVIGGARETLARDKPLIVCELPSLAEYRSFRDLIAPYGYRPSAIYNRTPTIVFSADDGAEDRSGDVEAGLRAYARRMIFAGPVQRLMQRMGFA